MPSAPAANTVLMPALLKIPSSRMELWIQFMKLRLESLTARYVDTAVILYLNPLSNTPTVRRELMSLIPPSDPTVVFF